MCAKCERLETFKQVLRFVLAAVVLLIIALAMSGCSVVPDKVSGCLGHVSHPLRGEPFGPASEEDSLDTIGACARWERGRFAIEQDLGYRWRDGGFYGDDFIYQGRVYYTLWEK